MLALADFIVLHVSYRDFIDMNPDFMTRNDFVGFCLDNMKAFDSTLTVDDLIPSLIDEYEFVKTLKMTFLQNNR